ncbi:MULTISPECIES: hypothetical protein [unclassified Sphingopyxis]|uniref:hypothetical protein n=1 Tax=unclassified Sphingopyxis TaxID=2614943 RepID=UPI0024AE845B|nr:MULTISPECIES: hypothetical protein [unclassified Sphingopyxis]
MAEKTAPSELGSQSKKFIDAARELETDNDPKRFDERLGRLVRHKPVEKSK